MNMRNYEEEARKRRISKSFGGYEQSYSNNVVQYSVLRHKVPEEFGGNGSLKLVIPSIPNDELKNREIV